jgi:hypothetical protein
MQNKFCCALCDYNYNLLKACIYFWALVFAWKIEMWNTQICVSAKSLHDLELNFGYVVQTSMCRSCAKISTKVLKEYVYINYLVILSNLPRWFFSLNIIIFEPYFWLLSGYGNMHLWWIYPDFISVRNIIPQFMLVFIHQCIDQDP